jgi:C2H2 transcription facotor
VNPNGSGDSYAQNTAVPEEQKVYHPHQIKPEPARADSGFQSFAQGPPPQTYALHAGHDARFGTNYQRPPNNDMGRLEALVAVATSENRAVERS